MVGVDRRVFVEALLYANIWVTQELRHPRSPLLLSQGVLVVGLLLCTQLRLHQSDDLNTLLSVAKWFSSDF